jgi:cell division transport system permease protein
MAARSTWIIQITSSVVLCFSLLLVGLLYSLIKSAQFAVIHSQKNVKLELFFKTDLKSAEDETWIEQIKSLPEVMMMSVITQEQAQDEFKKLMEPSLGSLSEEASLLGRLPSSIIVQFQENLAVETKRQKVSEIVNLAKQVESFDGHVFQAEWAQWIHQLGVQAEKLLMVVLFLIALIFFLIISNLVRGQVAHKQEEIEIRSFLGATLWQIEKPFIVSSIVTGLISSIVASALTLVLLEFLRDRLQSNQEFLSPELIRSPAFFEFAVLAVFVTLISAWAASVCVRERIQS